MKTLTKAQLLEKMLNVRGCRPVGLTTVTRPYRTKAHQHILKFQKTQGLVGFTYENSMQKVTGDATFEAGARAWGQHLTPVVIEHKGEHYIQVKQQGKPKARVYVANGQVVDAASLPKIVKAHQPVEVRDFKLSSIVGINIDGEQFKVV